MDVTLYKGALLQDFYAEDETNRQGGSLSTEDVLYLNPSKDENGLEDVLDSLEQEGVIEQDADGEYRMTETGKEKTESIFGEEVDEIVEDYEAVNLDA